MRLTGIVLGLTVFATPVLAQTPAEVREAVVKAIAPVQ
jgi:hypothetical protein